MILFRDERIILSKFERYSHPFIIKKNPLNVASLLFLLKASNYNFLIKTYIPKFQFCNLNLQKHCLSSVDIVYSSVYDSLNGRQSRYGLEQKEMMIVIFHL